MSDDSSKKSITEINNTVAITPDDVRAAVDFWSHYEVEMPQELKASFDTFINDPTFVNQQNLKFELCKAILNTDHPTFKDEMFKPIIQELTSVTYDMQFEKDLEQLLTKKDE